jgi:hypothetical protein
MLVYTAKRRKRETIEVQEEREGFFWGFVGSLVLEEPSSFRLKPFKIDGRDGRVGLARQELHALKHLSLYLSLLYTCKTFLTGIVKETFFLQPIFRWASPSAASAN